MGRPEAHPQPAADARTAAPTVAKMAHFCRFRTAQPPEAGPQ